jgi:hypothetical protein
MKVRVSIARSQREYADVIVEAESVEAAQAYVEQVLTDSTYAYAKAYCDLVNNVSWDTGEAFDEDVLDAEEHEDQDEEADVDASVPLGLRKRPGVEVGCGKADCTGCYEPNA